MSVVSDGRRQVGLGVVRVKRDDLIEKVRANRESHVATYEEALVGYRRVAQQKLHDALARFVEGEDATYKEPHLPVPESHADEYDWTLAQLEMEQDDELMLTAQEFRQYALDEWGWKAEFNRTTTGMGYVGDHGEYPSR